ncbi:MAG: hypothetical protein ACYC6L_06470 [Anaerolineae bacterium]
MEGSGVPPDEVRARLYQAYPELKPALASGSLLLEIEAVESLGEQLKSLKIVDLRR